MVMNGDMSFLLLELILADQLTNLPLQYRHLVVKNGNFTFLLIELILADQLEPADHLTLHLQIYPFQNGNLRCILIDSYPQSYADYVADQEADLPPVEASSGEEWCFHIPTVRAHIGRSTGTCRSPSSSRSPYIAPLDISPLKLQFEIHTDRFLPSELRQTR